VKWAYGMQGQRDNFITQTLCLCAELSLHQRQSCL